MWKRSVSNVVVVVWSYDLQKNATPNHIRVSRADSLRSDDLEELGLVFRHP